MLPWVHLAETTIVKIQAITVSKLMKGWFMFMLSSKDEAESLMSDTWEMAGVPIMLWCWCPIFDVAQSKTRKEHIWVKFPGLPIHLWTQGFF